MTAPVTPFIPAAVTALLERARKICFRVTDESVPLFSSQRLQTLHKDCGTLLQDIGTTLHDLPTDAKGPIAIWKHFPNGNNYLDVQQPWQGFEYPAELPLYASPRALFTRLEPTDEDRKFLDGCVGAVEASSEEYSSCYKAWDEYRKATDGPWKENLSGILPTVGFIAEFPVCISLRTAHLGPHKILFYHATSRLVDHDMVRDWLKLALPKSAIRADGYINHSDATNFTNVIPRG